MHLRDRAVLILTLVCLAGPSLGAAPGVAQQEDRFPSSDPDPRVGTPNDPRYDCSEPDDEDRGAVEPCHSIYDEQFNLFGFAPASTERTALYKDPARFGMGQVSGVSADRGWKHTIGSPEVAIAIIDTGVLWNDRDLRKKVWLNAAELPVPEGATSHDADGDGAFTVDDYAGDSRVTDANSNGLLDGQDLIRAFSDGVDDDQNGYVDDIAGWDFFDDDNDPADVSSYSSARNHGTGRAEEAAQETNEGAGGAGICPRCRVMMLRVWDSFVVPGDQYAMATVYAADAGALVQEIALGVTQNTRSAKAANRYAFEKGMALMQVSSDLNTANHNYPTNYNESVFVNGCVTDTEGISEDPPPGIAELIDELGIVDSQAPVQTYFRNSNLTQFGAHAHICMMGDTGSQATGQAAGAAGLVHSRGIELADDIGGRLTSNEVKQILTMTAEDVLPENTLGAGAPDPAQPGWDERFGYGRTDLGSALAMVAPGTIPPEAWIDDPAWWALLDPVEQASVPIEGHVSAGRSTGYEYELQWAPGVEPAEGDFLTFATGSGTQARDGELGSLDLDAVAAAIPGARTGTPPRDPNEYVFTVRLVASDADGNRGEDRKAYFVFHDPTLHEGWPRFEDTGGESSPVLYDLDGNGTLEIVDANSSGELTVFTASGELLESFNGGEPFVLPPPPNFHPGAPGFASGAVPPPTGGWRTPAIADVDGDLAPEIVAAAGAGEVYVIEADGTVASGFPVGVDPALSAVQVRTRANHVKTGIAGAPVVGDLDGDGTKEIVVAALDGHVYAWSATGVLRPGFPVRLADPDESFNGGEIFSTPGLADIDGDGTLEIISASNEVYDTENRSPSSPGDLVAAFRNLTTNVLANSIGGSSRYYALEDDGTYADGWPVAINGALPDALPLIGPGLAPAVADLDGDGKDEVVATISTSDVEVYGEGGTRENVFANTGAVGRTTDPVKILNLFEYTAIGDLDGGGPAVFTGGLSLNGLLNLALVGQNLPFDHVVQGWDGATGEYLPAFPRATDDWQLVSTPAIADADGQGGREVIVGTGLYLLHAYDSFGEEVDAFPKLTGGWLFSIPAVGDVDGDGALELAASTREGYRFLWDLDAPAAPEANQEWWTEAHDECHSNRYGTDCRPPTRVQDLSVEITDGGNGLDATLTFTASGDDWSVGTASRYEVRYSSTPIETFADWQNATPLEGLPDPEGAGQTETIELANLPGDTRSFAVVVVDDADNSSQLATITVGATETAIAYTGDSSARVGTKASLSATLTTASGAPVEGAALSFSLERDTVTATTDATGNAVAQLRVKGPPGPKTLVVSFAGAGDLLASRLEVPFTVETGSGGTGPASRERPAGSPFTSFFDHAFDLARKLILGKAAA
ncbi:MAG: S8 family serine peptidase [Actinomycetota bacterium]